MQEDCRKGKKVGEKERGERESENVSSICSSIELLDEDDGSVVPKIEKRQKAWEQRYRGMNGRGENAPLRTFVILKFTRLFSNTGERVPKDDLDDLSLPEPTGFSHDKRRYRNGQFRRKSYNSEDFYCDVCDVYVPSANIMESHVQGREHRRRVKPVEKFTCETCLITVSSKETLEAHEKVTFEVCVKHIGVIKLYSNPRARDTSAKWLSTSVRGMTTLRTGKTRRTKGRTPGSGRRTESSRRSWRYSGRTTRGSGGRCKNEKKVGGRRKKGNRYVCVSEYVVTERITESHSSSFTLDDSLRKLFQ